MSFFSPLSPERRDDFSDVVHELMKNRSTYLRDANRILGCFASAEDVIQDAAVRGMNAAATAIEKPRPFVRRMVQNLAIDQIRRKRDASAQDVDSVCGNECDPERCCMGREDLRAVCRTLDGFARRDRQIFLRHRVLGEEQRQLAEEYGLSPARIHAIIAKMHTALTGLREDAGG